MLNVKELAVVARDGIGPPTVFDSAQLIDPSFRYICHTGQNCRLLAQFWHKSVLSVSGRPRLSQTKPRTAARGRRQEREMQCLFCSKPPIRDAIRSRHS